MQCVCVCVFVCVCGWMMMEKGTMGYCGRGHPGCRDTTWQFFSFNFDSQFSFFISIILSPVERKFPLPAIGLGTLKWCLSTISITAQTQGGADFHVL